jgi:RNA-directed DNA polymerase
MKEVLLRIRHLPVREQYKAINVRLNGHYHYYGVGGNSYSIDHFYYFTLKYWRKALSSRSQNGKVNWIKFNRILNLFPSFLRCYCSRGE